MAEMHVESVDLNVSARDEQCKTSLDAEQTKHSTTGKQ